MPLGGNRLGNVRTYVNLMITMLLGGLWHGAAWTFVVWGGFHGAWLAVHRALSGRDWWRSRAGAAAATPATPLWLRRIATFHLVAFAWVPFRAASLADAGDFFVGLVSGRPLVAALPVGPILLVALGAATHGLATRVELASWWRTVPRPVQGAAYGLVVVLIGLFSAQSGRFIYFQF